VYLSRLQLNPRAKQVRTDLSSAYQTHATLCRAFCEEHETPPPFLWRYDLEKETLPTVLVQSQIEPDWEKLEARFPSYFQNVPQTKTIPLEQLETQQTLRFRLKANVTITQRNLETGKKQRHGLKTLEEQLEWFARQAQKGGFAPLGVMVAQSERVQIRKHDGGMPITLASVTFEGHLKITDLEPFKATLEGGIGHAKALGFGLLSIAAR
jgi:CRISPR system Cascade subunit CasE